MTRIVFILFVAACTTPKSNGDPTDTAPGGTGTTVLPSGPVVEVPEPPAPTDLSTSIGPEGGVLNLGKLKVSFPRHTVDAVTVIELHATDEMVDGYTVFSKMYRFTPEDLVVHSPLIVEIPFEADGATAKLYWSNAVDPTQYDEISGIVTGPIFAAVIDHLGHGFVGFKIPVIVVLTPPAAPTSVVAHAGDTEVDVTWAAVAGASSYKVGVATQAGGPYVALGTTATQKFTHHPVSNGTTYYYTVKANNADGDSPLSAEAAALPAPIEAPDGVLVTPGNGSITLNWLPPDHASTHASYVVYRLAEGASGATAIDSTSGTQIVDTSVVNGVDYTYTVRAVGPAPSGVTSGFSDPDTAFAYALAPTGSFVPLTGPGCASGLPGASGASGIYSATGCSPCAYSLKWTAADPQAQRYKIQLSLGSGDPKQGSVDLVSSPANAFLCQFAYRPDVAETNAVNVTVSTCYGPTGLDRCVPFEESASYQFLALGPSGNDECFNSTDYGPGGITGLTFSCPYP